MKKSNAEKIIENLQEYLTDNKIRENITKIYPGEYGAGFITALNTVRETLNRLVSENDKAVSISKDV